MVHRYAGAKLTKIQGIRVTTVAQSLCDVAMVVSRRKLERGMDDALLPDHRLIIEADGRRWHTRMNDFDRDQRRTNEATARGWGTLHFTWVHLTHFTDDVIDVVRRTVHPTSAA